LPSTHFFESEGNNFFFWRFPGKSFFRGKNQRQFSQGMSSKISGNPKRDRENYGKLRLAKWKIISIFESQLKKDKAEYTLKKLIQNIKESKYS
jgi:G:T-mismatch repair DNA endonuclease (very short patch repair protein)